MLARHRDGESSDVGKGIHEASADLQRRLSRADQLLVSAARDGDICLVQDLLGCTETVNINARDRKSGSTPLIMAAAWGHSKAVALLLDKGADPTLHNFEGRSALELSASTEITALLLGGLQNSSSPIKLLQQAAWHGNLPLVSQLLNECKDIGSSSCNGEGLSTLALAARDVKVFHQLHIQGLLSNYCPVEVVSKMISKGWKVNSCDQQGRTPLHYAAMFNSEISARIVELLLMNGARPNAADKHSFTPLHFAVKNKFLEATKLLLTAGAYVNQQTYAGHTALHIASSHGDLKLVRALLERGADVRAVTHSGLSTLKCAANRELHQLLKSALEVEKIQKPANDVLPQQDSDSEESDSLDLAVPKKNVIQADSVRKSSRDESSRSNRKTRNIRRHKSSSNLRKQHLLFTMHLGLAVAKGSTIDKQTPENKIQSASFEEEEDEADLTPTKPSSAPVRFSPLPSKIPIIAKSGSAGCIDRRDASPVRVSKPCLNCVAVKHVESSPNVGRKASSTVPDVVKTSIVNLLDSKELRKHRHSSPLRKDAFRRKAFESEHFLARNHHRPRDGDLFFLVKEPVVDNSLSNEAFLKISKPPSYPSLSKSSRNKQTVHFCVDTKQASGKRQKCRHPYSVSIRAYGKRGKPKAAKSDSELETSSVASVTGRTVSLLPQAERISKQGSRLPRKCRQPVEPESPLVTMPSITEQLAAMNINPMSTSSSTNCSSLEASLGVDCQSQSSSASWVYIPQEQHSNPPVAPARQRSRQRAVCYPSVAEEAEKNDCAKVTFPEELAKNVENCSGSVSKFWKNMSSDYACHSSSVIKWTKGKLLGKGAFGMVWCGMTSNGDLIAVKQIKLNTKDSVQEYQQIQQEFCMLQRLQHRNIVAYLGTQLEGTVVNIFMQYVAGGSLSNNLAQFGSFGEAVIRRYTRQILDGVHYLHGHGIVHRDIKGANIMVMPSETGGFIKLIDFGCAKMLHMSLQDSNHYIQSVRGTPYWMAPEVIQQTDCTEKSDIWSVGCTIIEMATTKPPWYELPPFSAAYAIGQGTSKPVIPESVSPWVKDFIELAMQRDPQARPMAAALLLHPFLAQNGDHSGATTT